MPFLNSLNHYRAIAILIIVVGHLYTISDIEFDSFFQNVIGNLITGGTINFVFISGFLFHSVFFKRFEYKTFFTNKVKRVLLPYLFLSILPIFIVLYPGPDYWLTLTKGNYVIDENMTSFFLYIFSGAHLTAYWYIPFIMLVFLMSPLHMRFIELKFKNQLLILIVLSLVSLFIQRPFERVTSFQAIHSLVYFTPIYLLGIICSTYRAKIYKTFKNKEFFLLFTAILLAIFQAYLGENGNFHQHLNNINGTVDIMFVQKMIMCLFFMVWLYKFENFTHSYITILAKFSFPIFFLHPFFKSIIFMFKKYFNINFDYPWLMLFVLAILISIGCVLIAKFIEKIFPKYSVMLIGYGEKKKKLLVFDRKSK